ncbi:acyltransferase family protein [Paenarthrobacter aromaticivorans]|uniref:Acyltransferase n=1 Tax=Paenarthrobacter aromaticivorans TaxID=2849150 RepID=A0ABS6I0M3_9MICC|nr:acyltransferase [Paenarthrobacter sp. MMS21-TAE1-1]MBU8865291.1 acyltransferase [Paenarthrobacter sp. MMS21-TAE1-1]
MQRAKPVHPPASRSTAVPGALNAQPEPAVQGVSAVRRDPAIDLVRFICLLLVVAAHCMMVSPVLHRDGKVTTQNTLMEQSWFTPVVWVLMIVPLFFVLGGVTGLQSWRRLKERGGSGFDFAQLRLLRLVRPAMALLAIMWAGLWLALLSGVDPQVIQLMTTGAAMPLWFLAAYLTAQVSIPLMARLHQRAPLPTLGVLVALIITVDSLRGAVPVLAFVNMVFVWCAVQQLGFLMADGFFEHRSRTWLVGAIIVSNLLLGLVTGVGVYPGNMVVNINPPNLCLLLLAISQSATLQLLGKGIRWIASVRWVQTIIAVAGRRSMTIYLWHLPLLVGMSGLLLLTDFPKPTDGTAEWWWARIPVFFAVVALLVPVVLLLGRLENRPTAASHARGPSRTAVTTAAVVVLIPVADAALNGLMLALLGGGAACFALAVLLLGRVPTPVLPQSGRDGTPSRGGKRPTLPAQGLRANLES